MSKVCLRHTAHSGNLGAATHGITPSSDLCEPYLSERSCDSTERMRAEQECLRAPQHQCDLLLRTDRSVVEDFFFNRVLNELNPNAVFLLRSRIL